MSNTCNTNNTEVVRVGLTKNNTNSDVMVYCDIKWNVIIDNDNDDVVSFWRYKNGVKITIARDKSLTTDNFVDFYTLNYEYVKQHYSLVFYEK